jgi:hypothetical protein
MIATCLYSGQGLGNQLWAYSVIRSIAEDRGCEFGFLGQKRFKGDVLFPNLKFGSHIEASPPAIPRVWIPNGFKYYYREEIVRNSNGIDVSLFDPKIWSAADGTFLDGGFQSEKYFSNPGKVKAWFDLGEKTRDVCTINLRGGEFKGVPSLFLPKQYFLDAISVVREADPKITFEVVTDDPKLARSWFPDYPVHSSGGVKRFHGGLYIHPKRSKIRDDFAKLQSSKYLILSNSSFSWWGAYTNLNAELIVAPKYWANFNGDDGQWSTGDSLTKSWVWLDKEGRTFDYSACLEEIQQRVSKEHDA